MRCYQHYGLTGVAEAWLREFCAVEPSVVCPECEHVIATKLVVLSEKQVDAFYDDGPVLHVYRTKDNHTVKEVVQDMPWSSTSPQKTLITLPPKSYLPKK